MISVQLDDVYTDPGFNCRGEIDPLTVAELADSIERVGLLQPIMVMRNPDSTDPVWKCVAGHRRIAAAKLLGWVTISAVVRDDLSDTDARKLNLSENLIRRDLTPTQEMRAIVAIYGDDPDASHVANELSKSKKWVYDRLRLREMEQRILDKVDEGLLGALDLQYLVTANPEERWNMAKMLMERKAKGLSSKSVAREMKIRKKVRGMKELRHAKAVLQDIGRTPGWVETLGWCAGDISSEEFFGLPLDKLKVHGILE